MTKRPGGVWRPTATDADWPVPELRFDLLLWAWLAREQVTGEQLDTDMAAG